MAAKDHQGPVGGHEPAPGSWGSRPDEASPQQDPHHPIDSRGRRPSASRGGFLGVFGRRRPQGRGAAEEESAEPGGDGQGRSQAAEDGRGKPGDASEGKGGGHSVDTMIAALFDPQQAEGDGEWHQRYPAADGSPRSLWELIYADWVAAQRPSAAREEAGALAEARPPVAEPGAPVRDDRAAAEANGEGPGEPEPEEPVQEPERQPGPAPGVAGIEGQIVAAEAEEAGDEAVAPQEVPVSPFAEAGALDYPAGGDDEPPGEPQGPPLSGTRPQRSAVGRFLDAFLGRGLAEDEAEEAKVGVAVDESEETGIAGVLAEVAVAEPAVDAVVLEVEAPEAAEEPSGEAEGAPSEPEPEAEPVAAEAPAEEEKEVAEAAEPEAAEVPAGEEEAPSEAEPEAEPVGAEALAEEEAAEEATAPEAGEKEGGEAETAVEAEAEAVADWGEAEEAGGGEEPAAPSIEEAPEAEGARSSRPLVGVSWETEEPPDALVEPEETWGEDVGAGAEEPPEGEAGEEAEEAGTTGWRARLRGAWGAFVGRRAPEPGAGEEAGAQEAAETDEEAWGPALAVSEELGEPEESEKTEGAGEAPGEGGAGAAPALAAPAEGSDVAAGWEEEPEPVGELVAEAEEAVGEVAEEWLPEERPAAAAPPPEGSRRRELLDDLSATSEGEEEPEGAPARKRRKAAKKTEAAGEGEETGGEEGAEAEEAEGKPRWHRSVKWWVGVGVLAVVAILAVSSVRNSMALHDWLAQPLAGRSAVAPVPSWPRVPETMETRSVAEVMTEDVPDYNTLSGLIGTRPEDQPPPNIVGRYFYSGSWTNLLNRLEAPASTQSIFLVPLARGTQRELASQPLMYKDVSVIIKADKGGLVAQTREENKWPPHEVFEAFSYSGGGAAPAVRDLDGPLALETWRVTGRKTPKPVTDADLGTLKKVVNASGKQVWPILTDTTKQPDGTVKMVSHLDADDITMISGATQDGWTFEEWSASKLPGYSLLGLWTGDKSWLKATERVRILLGEDGRPVLAFGRLPLYPGQGEAWCRWYSGAAPVLEQPQDWQTLLMDRRGLEIVVNETGTVLAAFGPRGREVTLQGLVDPNSEWRSRWQLEALPLSKGDMRFINRLSLPYTPIPSQG